MSTGGRHKARQAAVQALYQWQLTNELPEKLEAHYVLDHDVSGIDLEYFHELVSEVPRHLGEIDDHIKPHLDRPIDEVDPVERAILRAGIYELEFHLEIPYKVIINEAVELAKTFGAEHGHKYINAILDKSAAVLRAAELAAAK